MRMTILSLIIDTKSEIIEFPFSKTFTYIYGKMGAGKTTVVKLIAFCLGEDLVNTPALQQEFVRAKLHLTLGPNDVYLTRDIYEKNKVLVEWQKLNSKEGGKYVVVPINGEKGISVLPDFQIENLSDMIFYLIGGTPPKVRRSKVADASELIRLSFKNIMWFWNLDQDLIDSSFFHLEEKHGFHKNASRDVMRMILGYYYEKIATLENELATMQAKRRGMEESIHQLKIFLLENLIEGIEVIDENITKLKERQECVKIERSIALEIIQVNRPHISDRIRHDIYQYLNDIKTIEDAIINTTKQIELKKQLREEYFYASIKSKNLEVARDILKDAKFQVCPECGKIVEDTSDNVCSLCHRPVENEVMEKYSLMEIDLIERRNEIEISLKKMEIQKALLIKQLDELTVRKTELDILLSNEESEYDSLYLSNIKGFDHDLEIIDADIRYWNKIRALPQKVESLLTDLSKMILNENEKKGELDAAKDEAENQENQLENLKIIFLDTLERVKFPGIQQTDSVYMTTKDFYPKILTKENDIYEIDFVKLSSGGKKTIFKACFAIAIQRLLMANTTDNEIPFPSVLIIDTPMKNISERENKDIFESFYKFIYEILQKELIGMQLIIIDKEFYEPDENYKLDIISKHMTPDDPQYPGLIPYYIGH